MLPALIEFTIEWDRQRPKIRDYKRIGLQYGAGYFVGPFQSTMLYALGDKPLWIVCAIPCALAFGRSIRLFIFLASTLPGCWLEVVLVSSAERHNSCQMALFYCCCT